MATVGKVMTATSTAKKGGTTSAPTEQCGRAPTTSAAASREATPDLKSSTARSRSAEPKIEKAAAMTQQASNLRRSLAWKKDAEEAEDGGAMTGAPSYARSTQASRGGSPDRRPSSRGLATSQSTVKNMKSSTARSTSPAAKTRDPFKSDAEGASDELPRYARPTAASKSRDDENMSDEEQPRSPRKSESAVPKKRPVSADPRYTSGVRSPATRSHRNGDDSEEFCSPGARGSPNASTASSTSTRLVDLSVYVGCEDPALFELKPKDEDWALRDGNRTHNYFHRPSSVARLNPNADVAQFISWVESFPRGWEIVHEMFIKESSNPAGGEHLHRGHQPRAGLTKKRWTKLMMDNNYPNEAGLRAVFDEIAKEINTDKDKKPTLSELRDKPLDPEITLPQMKRFERRVQCVNAVLQPTDKNSPANRFVSWIKNKHGSTLQAWKTHLDQHETGRVSYADFLHGCRNMGMAQYGKPVWNNLKKDQANPMELHELDPKEGNNLEEFAEVLWEKMGFDMNKAWVKMDVMNQNYVTYDQFKTGCQAFGYWGDAKLLFRGLDGSGLGRVKKEDFKYICKVSRVAHRHFGHTDGVKNAGTELVSWCQREMGGPDRLVTLLGFGGRGGHGRMECSVSELAHRLEQLDFPSDANEAAAKTASVVGGSVITMQSFYKFLTCTHHHQNRLDSHLCEKSDSPRFKSNPKFRARSGEVPVEHRFGWNSSVDDITAHNKQCCKYFRGYFGLDEFMKQPITKQPLLGQATNFTPDYKPPARPQELSKRIEDHNPHWNGSQNQKETNANVSAPIRQNANDSSKQGPRDLQKAKSQKLLMNKYGGGGRSQQTY